MSVDKPLIFKQRKKYILMGTYEIHKNFGVCNKLEGIFVIISDPIEIGIV
jgi:hypothetical protein